MGSFSIRISRARLSPTTSGSHWVDPPQATEPTCVPTCLMMACWAIDGEIARELTLVAAPDRHAVETGDDRLAGVQDASM